MLLFFSPKGVSASRHDDDWKDKPKVEEDWRDSSACVAKTCGSDEGTKEQTLYKKVCEKTCPVVSFSDSHQVVDIPGHWSCPEGYEIKESNQQSYSQHDMKCEMKVTKYADKYWSNSSHSWKCPSDSEWYRSEDSSKKCSMEVVDYKDATWVKDTYKPEIFGPIDVAYILNSEDNKCYRPSSESLNIPDWAKDKFYDLHRTLDSKLTCSQQPTEITKIVNCTVEEVIACPAAGVCPTNCGLPEIQIPDGSGGLKTCLATEACVVADTGDVLGATTVVLAKTGAIDKSSVYLMQSILLLVTGGAFIYVGKEYLNRY